MKSSLDPNRSAHSWNHMQNSLQEFKNNRILIVIIVKYWPSFFLPLDIDNIMLSYIFELWPYSSSSSTYFFFFEKI